MKRDIIDIGPTDCDAGALYLVAVVGEAAVVVELVVVPVARQVAAVVAAVAVVVLSWLPG